MPEPHPLRVAMDARDHSAMVALLAPDVILHSPILGTGQFEGRAAVAELFAVLIEHYQDWRCLYECASGDIHVLVTQARVRGTDIDIVDVLRHDKQGRICEIRVAARPLSGVATLAAVLGPPLARRRSRLGAAALRAVTAPLPKLLHWGDRFGARISLPKPVELSDN